MTATGTVYALTDPRDGKPRYVGQTKTTLAVRLKRHLGKTAPRVAAWIAELRESGLSPLIVALRENVPVADLLTAEGEEITRIIAAGGKLLNENGIAAGHELLYRRREAERIAGWRELAHAAVAALGGPVPPGKLPMADNSSGRRWPDVRWLGGDIFRKSLKRQLALAAETPCIRCEDSSRFLSLVTWHMTAVHPWRHLAELGQLPADDASFIAWIGQDGEVAEALEFLASCGEGMLARLAARCELPELPGRGPGHLLGAVTAAYTGKAPEAVQPGIAEVLGHAAEDHMLTQPMADLLIHLNPRALDSVFGRNIAAEIDADLDLPAGTSGSVLQALGERIGDIYDKKVRRAIDRSAQALPMVALPDYGGWSGPGVPAARVISASLVRVGLAEPDDMSPEDYLAEVRALWAPRPVAEPAA